jgi:hypothetical protein
MSRRAKLRPMPGSEPAGGPASALGYRLFPASSLRFYVAAELLPHGGEYFLRKSVLFP